MGSNFEALNKTLDALVVEDVEAAQVEMARSLAQAVDKRPLSPGLWQQYREAIRELTQYGNDDDDAAKLLARLSAPVRN